MVLPSAAQVAAPEVFGALRVAVIRELDSPAVRDLLDELVTRGWRPRQLRERVGVLPVQPTSAQDAAVITAELRRLLEESSPQEQYDAELARRAREREDAARDAPAPAAPDERSRWIAAIRGSLKGSRTRVPFGPPVRLRPDCALCTGEAEFFVRRDVHLCSSCVDLLAAGEVRAERETGS
ncbi:MAG: hypothetical protein LC789_15165 [Actinobacteria bacterium]|nr:hypothetical protein [Actinomycetota bacterium]MCA1721387.1 hypothetical protein [Actinomycetota bacterium]